MPARRRFIESDPDEPRLEIMPLIDVVFLLLTFFIFSVALMVRADALDITLPSIRSGEAVKRTEIVSVTLLADGTVRINGDPVTETDLAARVLALSAEGSRVLVAADQATPAGALLRTLDALAGAGIENVGVIGTPEY